MKSLIAIALLTAGSAFAQCHTYGNITTCADGSTYNRVGNSTYGNNAQTGNSWQQHRYGNTTHGSDSQGRSWTQTHNGNTTFSTDSKGNTTMCSRIGQSVICN